MHCASHTRKYVDRYTKRKFWRTHIYSHIYYNDDLDVLYLDFSFVLFMWSLFCHMFFSVLYVPNFPTWLCFTWCYYPIMRILRYIYLLTSLLIIFSIGTFSASYKYHDVLGFNKRPQFYKIYMGYGTYLPMLHIHM